MEVRWGGGRSEHAEVMLDQTTQNKGGQGHKSSTEQGKIGLQDTVLIFVPANTVCYFMNVEGTQFNGIFLFLTISQGLNYFS